MTVSGYTRLAAIIGDPVRHSLSPVMHNAAFAAAGLDWLFVALPVVRGAGARAIDAIRVLGLEGLSVTMPHKADAAAACDEVRGDAARLQSVNCVSRGPGATLRFASARCHRKMARVRYRSRTRNSFGSFTTGQRSAKGKDNVHCRYPTFGSTSIRCAAVSWARRAPHEGHQPRDLQENAISVGS